MILLITYLLNLFDLYMTNLWVSRYGLSIEGNPIGRWLYASNAVPVVKICAVAIALAALGACIRKRQKLAWVAYIPLVVYALLAVWHVVTAIIISQI